MDIITRKEARERGLKRYYVGPCKHGHDAEKFTSNGRCVVCTMDKSAQWRKINDEYSAKYSKKWRERKATDDPEYISKEAEKKRIRENERYHTMKHDSDWINRRNISTRAANKRWKAKNTEHVRQYSSKWNQENRDINCFHSNKRRAKKLNATPSWLTQDQLDDIAFLYMEAEERTRTEGIQYHVDHRVPLNNDIVCGLHVAWNLQVIPAIENLQKSNKLL